MNIEIMPYDCIEDVVSMALHRVITKASRYSVAFVGEVDTIQSILSILLKDTNCTIDKVNMDICENNLYQLTMDEDGFISVIPIRNKYGDYLVVGADIRYISDEIPLSYFRRLNTCGEKYTVFGFDYDDELSDEEAEDLFDKADITAIQSKYSQLPENYQQLVDLILDWGLA